MLPRHDARVPVLRAPEDAGAAGSTSSVASASIAPSSSHDEIPPSTCGETSASSKHTTDPRERHRPRIIGTPEEPLRLLPDHKSWRVGVITDLHSNWLALDLLSRELLDVEKVDAVLMLGDAISDFSSPRRTLDGLYALEARVPTFSLRGNREEYLIYSFRDRISEVREPIYPSTQEGSLLYTASELRETDWDWLSRLPAAAVLRIGDTDPFTICHGSLRNSRELLIPETEGFRVLYTMLETPLLLHGHTHRQVDIRLGDHRVANPGSAGYCQRPRAISVEDMLAYLDAPEPGRLTSESDYLIMTYREGDPSDHRFPARLEFRTLAYDPYPLVADVQASGLLDAAPYWAGAALLDLISGQDYLLALVKHAAAIGKARGIAYDDLDESIFKQSYEEMLARNDIPPKYHPNLAPYIQ